MRQAGRVAIPANESSRWDRRRAVLVGAVTTAQIWAKSEWENSQDDEMDPYAMLDGLMNQTLASMTYLEVHND